MNRPRQPAVVRLLRVEPVCESLVAVYYGPHRAAELVWATAADPEQVGWQLFRLDAAGDPIGPEIWVGDLEAEQHLRVRPTRGGAWRKRASALRDRTRAEAIARALDLLAGAIGSEEA